MPNYTYEAISEGRGVWTVKRFDGGTEPDGSPRYEERLITMPPDAYEQQVIQRAIAEDSWA